MILRNHERRPRFRARQPPPFACHCEPVHGGPAKGVPLRGEEPQGNVAPPLAFRRRGAWRTLRREVWHSIPVAERQYIPPAPGVRKPTTRSMDVIANQCAHWCGNPFSPQGNLARWRQFGRIRYALRIRPKYCCFLRPAAGLRIATSLRSSP